MRPLQRILVIDDELEICELVADTAQAMGLTCTATQDPATFLEAVDSNISLIILDLMMPFIDGIEMLRLLANYKYQNGIVLMSGVDTRIIELAEQLATARGLSIVGRLKKPFRLSKLEDIRDMFSNSADCIVVQKTIEIGHDLGMRLVAEGVENQRQLDYLSSQSCDIAQGYLIYKPNPLPVVLSWLHKYRFFSNRPTVLSTIQ